jgi:hypothetical protein
MRSAHTPASTHDSWRWLASLQPCLASSALAVLLCPGIDFTHPPSCPAFPRMGFAGPSSRGPCTRPQQYYAGSDSSPARTRRQGLSAYFALPSEHPTPNHAMGPAITSHPRRCDRPGATTQASSRNRRLAAPRRRNGFVILRAARSPPAAPHPASRKTNTRSRTTQLPSATCGVTSHGLDSHLLTKQHHRRTIPRFRGE